jgi:DNA polymerase III subunit epsilon
VLRSLPLDACGFAVVDLETTGFSPERDAIVEVSVVHLDPGLEPRVAFDSVLDPQRPVTGTHVHGLDDTAVAGAPTFSQAAGDLARALAGRVLVGHNIAFDRMFLGSAFAPWGIDLDVPHVCTMYLRPLLGLGPRQSLDDACREAGVPRHSGHAAGVDAFDTAQLLRWQLAVLRQARVHTFADLARRGDYAFVRSFGFDPLAVDCAGELPGCEPQSRLSGAGGASHRHRVYFEALTAALMDLELTAVEAAQLAQLRRTLGFTLADVRAMHAQAFAGALLVFSGDQQIDERESGYLRKLGGCLSELGWAPGE